MTGFDIVLTKASDVILSGRRCEKMTRKKPQVGRHTSKIKEIDPSGPGH